ncbi:hypothetical protein O6H91_01G109400 [Diphasiastrum complanatum]|uniref:Uncharacterized protein n=1 Tax=Diphasiastrum complanatum TaxID=34168 RepID=A0ACC2EUU5_DIPCM|nr:hypothetical protein O6H91_01G109400 [Diphasiastrum complanatum]
MGDSYCRLLIRERPNPKPSDLEQHNFIIKTTSYQLIVGQLNRRRVDNNLSWCILPHKLTIIITSHTRMREKLNGPQNSIVEALVAHTLQRCPFSCGSLRYLLMHKEGLIHRATQSTPHPNCLKMMKMII